MQPSILTRPPEGIPEPWCQILLHHVVFRHSNKKSKQIPSILPCQPATHTHRIPPQIKSVATYRKMWTLVSYFSFWRYDTMEFFLSDRSKKHPSNRREKFPDLCIFKFFSKVISSLFRQWLIFNFKLVDYSYSHWPRIKALSNYNQVVNFFSLKNFMLLFSCELISTLFSLLKVERTF